MKKATFQLENIMEARETSVKVELTLLRGYSLKMKATYLIPMFSLLLLPAHTLSAQWDTVFFADGGGIYAASSELEKPADPMNFGPYSPVNLFDKDPASSWVEGKEGPGIGSYVLIGITGPLEKFILISNGYQKSEDLFIKNNRVKDFRISLYAGFTSDIRAGQFGFEADITEIAPPVTLSLKDEMGIQTFELPFDTAETEELKDSRRSHYAESWPGEIGIRDFFVLKVEIASVYKGSRWDDTCIAGIEFSNSPPGAMLNPGESVSGVRISADSSTVYLETSENRELILADNRGTGPGEFLSYTLMDASPDRNWAVISTQHGSTEGGRIEESYHLWSISRMKEVPGALMEAYGATPLGFTLKSGRLYLETFEEKDVLLEDLDLDMENPHWQ